MKKSLLISVDFDGTIVGHDFPRIGKEMPDAFETMRDLIKAGHRLILNTCRENHEDDLDRQFLTYAIEYCKKNGVEFISHNENRLEDDFRDSKLRRKIYANVHIDDRNLGGFPGWHVVRELLLTS